MSTSVKYDAREARRIAWQLVEAGKKDMDGRELAAKDLIAALAALVDELPGLYRERNSLGDGTSIRFGVKHGSGFVLWFAEDSGVIKVQRVKRYGDAAIGEPAEVPLDYDPSEKRFEGASADLTRAPTPGEPLPKRAALAVVLETAAGLPLSEAA